MVVEPKKFGVLYTPPYMNGVEQVLCILEEAQEEERRLSRRNCGGYRARWAGAWLKAAIGFKYSNNFSRMKKGFLNLLLDEKKRMKTK